MDKKQKAVIISYIIVLVAISAIYLVIPFEKTSAMWVAYFFSLFSVIAGFFITYIAFRKSDTLKSKFYGFPVFKVGIIYAAVQIFICGFICVKGQRVDIPIWLSLAVCIVLACLAGIGVIATDTARDIIEEQEEETERSLRTSKNFRINIDDIVSSCKDVELKRKLLRLSEDFRYSDPVSSPELEEIEAHLAWKIEELKSAVKSGSADAFEKADDVSELLEARNRRCKMYK